jgi:hypothetical protein
MNGRKEGRKGEKKEGKKEYTHKTNQNLRGKMINAVSIGI